MAQQKIYLRKVRDFGENLGDTFQFIRQELKPLLKSFFLISGIFMLGAAIVSGIYQMEIFGVFDKIEKNPSDDTGMGRIFGSIFTPTYFLIILLFVLGMVAMNVTVASYMKVYDQLETSPTLEQVWNEFKKYFLRALILSLLISVLIAVGLVLCVLPGIYLAVVFTPVVFIMVNEDASIGEAFSRCFALVKENFWISLGIYFVAYLIYSFAAGIIGVVLGIFIGISTYLSTKEMDSTMAIVNSVTNVFSYMFYVVFAVAVGLHYYNLSEKLDGVGMMRRLDTLGSTDPNAKIEEQY